VFIFPDCYGEIAIMREKAIALPTPFGADGGLPQPPAPTTGMTEKRNINLIQIFN